MHLGSAETGHAAALQWIVGVLHTLGVPFQAVGGLAARAYGAGRPLNDLDFYVPTTQLENVATSVAAFLVRRPASYEDRSWRLSFMRAEYAGCAIELGGAEGTYFFDAATGRWRTADIDFTASVQRVVLGVRIPVMPVHQLLAYKTALARDVDVLDVAEILANPQVSNSPSG